VRGLLQLWREALRCLGDVDSQRPLNSQQD
jgi:hypothetical protein